MKYKKYISKLYAGRSLAYCNFTLLSSSLTSSAKLLITITIFLMLTACSSKAEKQAEPLIPLFYSSVSAIVEAPAHVAYQKKMFESEGLDLQIEINPDGKTSLEHVLSGKSNIASVMATPVVYKSFDRSDFYIIGNIEHGKIHSLLVRNDNDIEEAEDLVGKRIAVTKGTSGEFFMNSYLILNGLMPEELDIRYMSAQKMLAALESNEIDALFCWQPFPLLASKVLADKAKFLSTARLVPSSWIIVAQKDYVEQNPHIIRKFLRAINTGVQYVNGHLQESAIIHADIGGIDKDIALELLSGITFDLSLDQKLLLDLEDQARWLIAYDYVEKKQVPNYLDLIYLDALKQILPLHTNILGGKNDN